MQSFILMAEYNNFTSIGLEVRINSNQQIWQFGTTGSTKAQLAAKRHNLLHQVQPTDLIYFFVHQFSLENEYIWEPKILAFYLNCWQHRLNQPKQSMHRHRENKERATRFTNRLCRARVQFRRILLPSILVYDLSVTQRHLNQCVKTCTWEIALWKMEVENT